MPRIARRYIESIFYLYPSAESALAGDQAGGTGVLIGVDLPRGMGAVVLAVTARHVVHRDGCSVIRLNTRDGKADAIDLDPVEWFEHPDGDDLAVAFVDVDPTHHVFHFISALNCVTRGHVEHESVGLGDEVFMVGRFVNCDGDLVNVPSVRFGHLSMMPISIEHEDTPTGLQESFAVEMLSRPGYSGSPVFVWRGPWDTETGMYSINGADDHIVRLLGINWGFVTEHAEVREKTVMASLPPVVRPVKYVSQNTGLNGVVPAWRVIDLLESPQVKKRIVVAARVAAKNKRGGTELASAAGNQKRFKETVASLLNTPPKPHADQKKVGKK